MADVSKIKLPDNSEYNIKDAGAIHSVKTINSQSIEGTGNITVSNTTYSISISNNVITLTGSDGSTSTVTLPVYDGGVSS